MYTDSALFSVEATASSSPLLSDDLAWSLSGAFYNATTSAPSPYYVEFGVFYEITLNSEDLWLRGVTANIQGAHNMKVSVFYTHTDDVPFKSKVSCSLQIT